VARAAGFILKCCDWGGDLLSNPWAMAEAGSNTFWDFIGRPRDPAFPDVNRRTNA
jgi:hypothetical protein